MKIPCSPAPLAVFLAALPFLLVRAADTSFTIVVSAGEFDRHQTVTSLVLPPEARGHRQLIDAKGNNVPIQTDDSGRAWFSIQELRRGNETKFQLKPGSAKSEPPTTVEVTRESGRLKVAVGGKHFLSYQTEKNDLPRPDIKPVYKRGGYIHPLLSPSGKLVTDDYPPNHIHHHGIWFPWTKTEFQGRELDFWNMGEGKGTVEFVELGKTWRGPLHGGFDTRHQFVDLTAPEPKAVLNETWRVTVYNVGQGARKYSMLDLVSTQECATASPLKLPKYHYGGLGFRGNRDWNGKDKTFFLTSEGETDRVKGNETRGAWCHISGNVGGALAGVAILCHPDNFRAPQPMRLHPSEPFFCFAPSQLGDWEIVPGKPFVSRYRFVVADGPPDKDELERIWNDYASPPLARIR